VEVFKDLFEVPILPAKIEPGDSFSVCLTRTEQLRQHLGDATVTGAFMTDKIGRDFRADPSDVRAAAQRVLEMAGD
jgi:hypothetical protein